MSPVTLRTAVLLVSGMALGSVSAFGTAGLPNVKHVKFTSGTVDCRKVWAYTPQVFAAEAAQMREIFARSGIEETTPGLRLSVNVGSFQGNIPGAHDAPEAVNRGAEEGYYLSVGPERIEINAATSAGAYYGVQTLAHLLADGATSVRACEIEDWPDFSFRMVMVDPARQNENFDYYRRLIDFCARQKLNAILLHLTDDQTATLYEPNYPELLPPHAWKQEEARALAQYARDRHIQLIPEIESCGHSRMFIRRTDYPDYLHQTTTQRKPSDWMGTDKPGYTNVLCPASEKAYEYVERMVEAADAFDSPVVHLGFDEVDMTTCARCMAKWPGQPPDYWFRQQLERNIAIAEKHGKRAAVWGDMLLKHPKMLDGIEPKRLVIYDWQYHPNVTNESTRFFTSRGFEVVACPSLMCSPHVVLPDELNYNNVRSFAKVGRDAKLAGLNTTFWLPTRYLSGAMWPAFAYAGAQAWGGSTDREPHDGVYATRWDVDCLGAFAEEHFGVHAPAGFTQMWNQLATSTLNLRNFETACYLDDEGLSQAKMLARRMKGQIAAKQAMLLQARRQIAELRHQVKRNREDWQAIEHSAEIIGFALDRLQAITGEPAGNRDFKERAKKILGWIMADWIRNRYPGDPNLDGTYVMGQNVAWRFRRLAE